jgi:hypothetical protein
VKILQLVGPLRFDDALQHCLRTSAFRPDICDLREYLGLHSQPLMERSGENALRWLLQVLRRHGVEMRTVNGKLIREKGRVDGVWHGDEYEQVPPPEIPAEILATLEILGMGDKKAGVELMARHPALSKNAEEYESLGLRLSAEEKLEARWMTAWKKVNR